MQKVTGKQTAIVLGVLVVITVLIKLVVGSDNTPVKSINPPSITTTSLTNDNQLTTDAKVYADKIKQKLKKDLQTIDVHLADEGSLKWLFITVSYNEWRSIKEDGRKDLVILLLRHMKQTYPNNSLQVSVGINADQPLAEGEWSQLSDGPSVKLIGD